MKLAANGDAAEGRKRDLECEFRVCEAGVKVPLNCCVLSSSVPFCMRMHGIIPGCICYYTRKSSFGTGIISPP